MSRSRLRRILDRLLSLERREPEPPPPQPEAPSPDPPSDDPQQELDLLDDLVSQGKSRQAVDLLRRLCRRMPQATELQLRLAELLVDTGRREEALSLARRLGEDPAHGPQPHVLAGSLLDREADLKAALAHYEAALALDLSHPRARGHADALRARLDRPGSGASHPTLLGPEELGRDSRFLLRQELGRGGGGTVYLAHDRSLGRPVAVKVLHPHIAKDPGARARLFCEARIAAALAHPGIVTIYDLEETLNLIVMEHCAGGALSERLSAEGAPVPLGDALDLIARVCGILDMVHRCGVVHRDLKPANLLFRDRPGTRPILTDFGIAHAGGLKDDQQQQAAGSLLYVAPEARGGSRIDPRADLHACGVILLQMLLGRPPLTPQQAVLGTPILELDEVWQRLRDEQPAPVIDLARSLVNPDVARRPGTAQEVEVRARALSSHLARLDTGRAVMQELGRRAGPPPHDSETTRWLADQKRRLEPDWESV